MPSRVIQLTLDSREQSDDTPSSGDAAEGASAGESSSRLLEEEVPLQHGCEDHWTWNKLDCSREVRLHGAGKRVVLFHPDWSSGTAGVRGSRVLNNARYFWEIRLSHRIFGTSMMVGVGTQQARLHADRFVNLLGEDSNGWGLSHKGLLWHGGQWSPYTKPFRENEATTVGILFDGIAGTITFYKDGKCLGVAFRGLDNVREPLYPIVCSTAAKTEMTLVTMRRDFVNLQDRCRALIVTKILQAAETTDNNLCGCEDSDDEDAASRRKNRLNSKPSLDQLFIPKPLKLYLAEALQEAVMLQSMDSCSRSLRWRRKSSSKRNIYNQGDRC